LADQLEVTLVDAELKADTFFPKIDEKKWLKTNETTHQKDEKINLILVFKHLKEF
jgi:dihydrofolate reductase